MKDKVTPTQRMLNIWAIILIIWALYRANFKMSDVFDEFIAKPMVFILPVAYYIRTVEKKRFFPAVWFHGKSVANDLLEGLIIGGIFFASAILAHFLKYKTLIPTTTDAGGNSMPVIITLAFATAVSEEILSRGFVLKRLYEESKNLYTSIFYSSLLFFFLHIPILFTSSKVSGNMLLVVMVTDILLSIISSFVYLQKKSLILPILIHAFYNLAIILFI